MQKVQRGHLVLLSGEMQLFLCSGHMCWDNKQTAFLSLRERVRRTLLSHTILFHYTVFKDWK